MTTTPKGLHDERTRVTLFLPIKNVKHDKAVRAIVDFLKKKHNSTIPVRGFTRSVLMPAPFVGYWWSERQVKRTGDGWIDEPVVCFIIDYGIHFESEKVPEVLEELKQTVVEAYRNNGSKQEAVWIIAQQVTRYV